MNIFKFAMQMEKDGEQLYRNLQQKTGDEGLRHILKMLADAEVKHYRIVEQMSHNAGNIQVEEEPVLNQAKNVFIKMKENGAVPTLELSQKELYQKALEIEIKSIDFYTEKAGETESSEHRTILKKLADEEEKHKLLIENIIDFISRPEQWLENAEWVHLDEY